MTKPFFTACKDGNIEGVAVHDSLEDVNNQHIHSFEYWTPLMIAIKEGHTNIVMILLCREDIDIAARQKRSFGSFANTALHIACEYGNSECLKLLLKDKRMTEELINKKNDRGQTALARCKYEKNIELMLNQSEVDISAEFDTCNTVLHFSCLNGFEKCVKFLLKDSRLTSQILNQRSRYGNTSLMEAIKYPKIVKMLLSREDLDITKTNNDSDTALNMAFTSNKNESVTLLLEDSRMTFNIVNKEQKNMGRRH